MTIDPDERREYEAIAKANYISGEFGINRITAILTMCGYTASQISDFIAENRAAAIASMSERAARQGRI
jgi:hypothetical protein